MCFGLFSVPSEPCSLKVTAIATRSVTLQWKPPRTTNGVITYYSIQYSDIVTNNFGNDTLMGTVEGLSPDTEYYLQLKAHTKVAAGPPCNMTIKTRKLLNILCINKLMLSHLNTIVGST